MQENQPTTKMLMVPLRGVSVYPNMLIHLDVGREASIQAFQQAMERDEPIYLVTQRNQAEDPEMEDLFPMGTISSVRQVIRLPGGLLRVLAEGNRRARHLAVELEDGCRYAQVMEAQERKGEGGVRMDALRECLLERFAALCEHAPLPQEVQAVIQSIEDNGQLTDTIAAKTLGNLEQEQEILAQTNVAKRMELLCVYLSKLLEVKSLAESIDKKVRRQMEKNQREYYLREQEKVIRQELGEGEEGAIQALRERLQGLTLPEEAREKVEKELDRMERLPSSSPEMEVCRNYVETILSLPFGVYTQDDLSIERARKVLDEDHYGLERVKERILEFLAVHALTGAKRGAVLCLVGPPGVGKTSIATAVAKALNRKFARISLGGVHDESEIRGHRRTYIGSMPGRILNSVKQAGSMNPLILMDEIDKMEVSAHGDPSAALLEVLDVEQNTTFRDHYADIPFDLSKALFFITANTLDTVARPLVDRMEVIEISGYTDEEKLQIAKRHLLPKQLERHGLKKSFLKLDEETLRAIIDGYTREAGVRNLERELATLCRKGAVLALEGKKSVKVTKKRLQELLGPPKFLRDQAELAAPRVGTVNGLAWTSAGGEMLVVEAVPMKGSGQLLLTGNLGEVMQESAKAAVSYIRAHAQELSVDADFHKTTDIHIHVPEGATPKDGPSAGVTIASAVASALSGKPARQDLAMTGEITLRGRVLPIGGLKEKTLAAYRQGIRTVLFPAENLADLAEIPENVRGQMQLVMVRSIDEVLRRVLVDPPAQGPQGAR